MRCQEQNQGIAHDPWWADHLNHPSGPTQGSTPALTPFKEPADPPKLTKKTYYLFSLLPATAGVPLKIQMKLPTQKKKTHGHGQDLWLPRWRGREGDGLSTWG